jgi:hypothetical protein
MANRSSLGDMKKAEQKDEKKRQEMYAGGNNAQGKKHDEPSY